MKFNQAAPGIKKQIGEREAKAKPDPVSAAADVSPAPGAGGGAVLDDVAEFLGLFVVYPSHHAKHAHALWIAHTHLMHVWDSTPRLAFLSPEPASGKTRALEVSELLVPSPVEAINVSPAYLFRKVGDQGASTTILFDEIDTVFGPKAKENEEIRGLLNAGHRRGAVAGRCVVRGKEVLTEEIPAYCALALAGLGWLPDTILSRSIIVRMRRRKPGEKIKPFRRRTELKAGHRLRDRLADWAKGVNPDLDQIQMPDGVEDRDADVWESLFAIADAAGGEWRKRTRAAAAALIKEARDVEPSLGIRLLADLKTIFGNAQEMTTECILRALHVLPEGPWNDLKGKPLNDRGLAQRLRQYGVKPKVIRVSESETTLRGYTQTDLHDVWETYLPPPPADTSETSETNETSSKDRSLFNAQSVSDGGKSSVTDGNASETSGGVVSDRAANVSHHVSDRGEKSANKINDVSDVSDVSLVAAGGRGCLQCGQPLGPGSREITVRSTDTGQLVPIHEDCLTQWRLTGPSC